MKGRLLKGLRHLIIWTIVSIVWAYCLLSPFFGSDLFFQHIVFCSEIRGVLLNNGQPLPGVEVKRTIHSDGFEGDQFEDRTITDGQGRYAFPEVAGFRVVRPSFLSSNPHALITLEARRSTYDYFLWSGGNPKFKTGGETGRVPIELSSDLAEAEGAGAYKTLRSKQVGDQQ